MTPSAAGQASELTICERRARPDAALTAALGSALFARVFAARGVGNPSELDLSLARLAPPAELANVNAAVERIARAVESGERILFVGDFDADGATSVALGVSLLAAMGLRQVDFLVPNRFEFGYGLTPEIVALARDTFRASGLPALVITVDNGVSSIEGVAAARALGMDVVVTDHHLPGAELPDATAIVNPNLPGCRFPSKALAGVGVIYYVLAGVRARLRSGGWFADNRIPEPRLADWLDLVALGTVADVVPLDYNNRILVQQGLRRIRAGNARPGIRALAEVADRDIRTLMAADLGYAIGPRLNAAGRLDDMSIGIQCLLAESMDAARDLARVLDELNRSRREIEAGMTQQAELIVAGMDFSADPGYGLSVYDPGWHPGVVGIVAGRIRERFNRPTIAFADAGPQAPDELKGSARSLPELHIRDVLDALATRFPGLIRTFGGHAMAAGLSIKRVHYERFARAFDRQVADWLPEEALGRVAMSDGQLEVADLTLDTALEIERLGPWGQHFPEPQFHGEFELVHQRVVGERHLKMVLRRERTLVDAIAFNQPPLSADVCSVSTLYRLGVNRYRDTATLQLVVEHIVPAC